MRATQLSWRSSVVALVCAVAFCAVRANAEAVEVVNKLIDSPLDDIQWADSQTVFVLSERGQVYRSVDGGARWTKVQDKLEGAEAENIKVRSMHISRVDPRKVFFIGSNGRNWITTDMGLTYKTTQAVDIHEVRLHPTQSNWVLAASMSKGCKPQDEQTKKKKKKRDCFKQLHVSKDFGVTFAQAVHYVVQFDWAPTETSVRKAVTRLHSEIVAEKQHYDPSPTTNDDLVYATIHELKEGNQKFGMWDKNIHFYQSFDYFKTSSVLVPHGNRFLFGDHSYLFVAAVNPAQEQQVSLAVSRDSGPVKNFKMALLPVELTEHSYTILDTSEGSVFLHVNHQPFDQNAPTGHVYISDWSGTRYSLSLPHNHRSADGKCDFEKVEGLEGIYLANYIDESEEEEDKTAADENWETNNEDRDRVDNTEGGGANKASRVRQTRTKTVITFDKGGIWSYLEAPKTDSSGHEISCSSDNNCHLHLHGITDLYGPFYSSGSAVGLIMSTGKVGSYLQEGASSGAANINTYLSRDAGLSWFEVAKGSHIYEFGDHGGLIVMAYDEGETKDILYSWDQGLTWTSVPISATPLQVENIIIEPEATSQKFIVYGWQGETGVLIHLDFTNLRERECKGLDAPDQASSDYETWTPSDGRLGGKCLLGHKVTYTRRKREAACFNPQKLETAVAHDNCACNEEDFECDYGYMRANLESGECVVDPDADPAPEEPCTDFYYVTKGYRRVAGDTCTNGANWDRLQVACPSWGGSHVGKVILIVLALVVISLFIVTGITKFEWFEDCVDRVKDRFRSGYESVDSKKAPHSMVEDEFGMDEPDLGQSASLIKDMTKGMAAAVADKPKGKSKKGAKDADEETHSFKPLPARKAVKPAVIPKLAPPEDSHETAVDVDDFDPRQ